MILIFAVYHVPNRFESSMIDDDLLDGCWYLREVYD